MENLQSVLMEYLDVDWKTDQFADLLFGDYLNREDKVWWLRRGSRRKFFIM